MDPPDLSHSLTIGYEPASVDEDGPPSKSGGPDPLGETLAPFDAVDVSFALDPSSDDPSSGVTVAGPTGQSTPRERPVPVIDGYEILGELGRGGMGVVYRARQLLLNRPCVLKMILGGAHAGEEAAFRFLAEAEAIARLQHPNVVQIYHIGEAEGLPYLELEFVEGGSLDRRLDGTPWRPREAATLIEALSRGVAEAHRLGIVHRDLKPGNVLLAADGTPKVTDFGLAKSMANESGLTRTDSIMGSPGYMAPEQAEGKTKQLGPLADVYALGAMLYELLTGRPPFRGATVLETLEQVKTAEPVPPSRLVPGLPRDVETIALKCLQKELGKRYDSAPALTEDLRRFLGGEPIVGRPVPIWERGWRWCRRHPVPAALTAAVVLVAALGLAGILWQWGEAVKARDLAATRATSEAEARGEEAKARREIETTLADMYTANGIVAGDQGDHARAALWFANAARRAGADPNRRLANSVRARTWGRQAPSPIRAVVAEGPRPVGVVVHPGGRHLITRGVVGGQARDARHVLWDLEAERPIPFAAGLTEVPAAAWSPDGKVLASGLADGDVILRGFPEGGETTWIEFPRPIRLLEFSPDGRRLAIAGGDLVRIWDVPARDFATPVLTHPDAVTNLEFRPDGRYLATGCLDNQARLFSASDPVAEAPAWPPVPHVQVKAGSPWFPEFFSPPRFGDGGRVLITYGGHKLLTVRDVESGAEVRTIDAPGLAGTSPAADGRSIMRYSAFEVSPDGRYLAALGFQSPRIQLFEVATGRPIGSFLRHENTVLGATFSPDGLTLLTGSTDNTARRWSVPGGEPLSRPLDLHRSVKVVSFAPDGRSMATQDGELVRLWALPGDGLPMARVPLPSHSSFASLSPDGSLLIPTGMSFAGQSALASTRAFRVETGEPAGPTLDLGGPLVDAEFSPDGKTVATLGAAGSKAGPEVVAWDWSGGRPAWRAALPSHPRALSHRRDGQRLAVLCGGGELLIFEAGSGREVRRWAAHDAEPPHHWVNNGEVAFSPDGRSVLSWGMGNDARVWDLESGRPRYPPLVHRDKCHDLQFSPDGRLMALASYDGSVRVRDLATGAVLVDLPRHPDMAYSATFSPDGELLATACRDRSIRVWRWREGRLACPPFEHSKEALGVAFTADGRWVLSASVDGTARAWDWHSGGPVTPPLRVGDEPETLAIAPDGRHAVVGGAVPSLAVLDLDELGRTDHDPADLRLEAELRAGQRLHEGGGTVKLSAEEWIALWRSSRKRSAD